jgi:RNA polymerase sigma factor (sigma-70 family)
VIQGDTEALDFWIRLEHPRVWRLALGFLAQAEGADDLAQEAMLKLHDNLNRWDSARPYAQWRNTVVLNLCRDRLRRDGSRRQTESGAEKHPALPDPSAVAEQGELRELLNGAPALLTDAEPSAPSDGLSKSFLVIADAPENGTVLVHGSVRLVLLTNMEETFQDSPVSGNTAEPRFGLTQEK